VVTSLKVDYQLINGSQNYNINKSKKMENQLTILPIEVAEIAKNVSVEKRNEVQSVLNHVFNGVAKMREQLDVVTVIDANDKVNMKLANTIRLGVRQVRLDAEKTFDTKRGEVQQAMLSFKTEDSLWLKAKQTMQILTKEIEENARWKEETKERFELEQKELKTQQRMFKVAKLAPEILRSDFENMSDETFEIFFAGIEKAFNDKIANEKKAEEERIAKEKAEAEARDQQKLENERLKAEAEKREKEIEAERKKVEVEREKERAIAKAEQEKAEVEREKERAIAKAEQEKAEATAKIEAEKREKLEAELQAKKDAEMKAENERKQAELKAKAEAKKNAKAPIKKQLNNWVESFEIPIFSIENEKAKQITLKFEAFKKWAKNEIETL
jgi:hypothetical protein